MNVIPLRNIETAAGQITFVDAMIMGCAIIVTRTTGSEDYIKHGETGILVKPHSVDDLTQAIYMLWNNQEKREQLGQKAKRYSIEHFSKRKEGEVLGQILDSLANKASNY